MSWRVIWSWRSAIIAVAFIAAVAVNLWFVETGFEAKCITESAQFHLGPDNPNWRLDGASLIRDPGRPGEPFSGDFRPGSYATVTVERVGKGPLFIEVDASERSRTAATIRKKHSQDEKLGPSVSLIMDNLNASGSQKGNVSLVLPINGVAEIGKVLSDEVSFVNPILRSGTVRILGRTFIGNSLFDAGNRELLLGDDLTFEPETSSGVGVLSAGDDSGIAVVYRMVGKAAVVRRFGAQDFRMRVSLYSRVAGDTSLQLIWAAVLAFTSGLRFISPAEKERKLAANRGPHRPISYIPQVRARVGGRSDPVNGIGRRAKNLPRT